MRSAGLFLAFCAVSLGLALLPITYAVALGMLVAFLVFSEM